MKPFDLYRSVQTIRGPGLTSKAFEPTPRPNVLTGYHPGESAIKQSSQTPERQEIPSEAAIRAAQAIADAGYLECYGDDQIRDIAEIIDREMPLPFTEDTELRE